MAALGFPIFDEFGFGLGLLQSVFPWNVLPLVRLKNRSYVLWVVDTNRCTNDVNQLSILRVFSRHRWALEVKEIVKMLTLQEGNHLDKSLSLRSSDLTFPWAHNNSVLRVCSNMVRVCIENNDLRKVAVEI